MSIEPQKKAYKVVRIIFLLPQIPKLENKYFYSY